MQPELDALQRVQAALAVYSDLQVVTFTEDTSTCELAAQTLGVQTGQIAKTLCFVGDGQPFLVVAVGDKKIDTKRLGKKLGVKKVRFADAQTVEDTTGFSPGGVCPFALRTSVQVYLDDNLFAYDLVYVGAGTSSSLLAIAPPVLQDITNGTVVNVNP